MGVFTAPAPSVFLAPHLRVIPQITVAVSSLGMPVPELFPILLSQAITELNKAGAFLTTAPSPSPALPSQAMLPMLH